MSKFVGRPDIGDNQIDSGLWMCLPFQ